MLIQTYKNISVPKIEYLYIEGICIGKMKNSKAFEYIYKCICCKYITYMKFYSCSCSINYAIISKKEKLKV